jgi:hypothetical protein
LVIDPDLARNDDPVRLRPAAGHPRATAFSGIVRQFLAVGEHDVTLEKRQEFLLLEREPVICGIAALNLPIDGGFGTRAITWRIGPD